MLCFDRDTIPCDTMRRTESCFASPAPLSAISSKAIFGPRYKDASLQQSKKFDIQLCIFASHFISLLKKAFFEDTSLPAAFIPYIFSAFTFSQICSNSLNQTQLSHHHASFSTSCTSFGGYRLRCSHSCTFGSTAFVVCRLTRI